jgi:hypothetical protein
MEHPFVHHLVREASQKHAADNFLHRGVDLLHAAMLKANHNPHHHIVVT